MQLKKQELQMQLKQLMELLVLQLEFIELLMELTILQKHRGNTLKAVGPGSEEAKPGEKYNKEIFDMILHCLYIISTKGSENENDVSIKIRNKLSETSTTQAQSEINVPPRPIGSEEQLKGYNPFYGRMVTCDMFRALNKIMMKSTQKDIKEKIAQIIANGFRAREIPQDYRFIIQILGDAVRYAIDQKNKGKALLKFRILIWNSKNLEQDMFREICEHLIKEIKNATLPIIINLSLQILIRVGNYGPDYLQQLLKQRLEIEEPKILDYIKTKGNSDQETKESAFPWFF
ncbi:MAG: hypothetical protein EZS28_037612 [Streblomastix strix]|uniref:Uncharacterized protein n=1 Tax=Streblomastix strix TaxID=222440 RepID=A0A5J4UAD3_9EUKA|nr:MAG: hypothetical protein EZS28_037612 [Streblomastix strix]